MGFLDKLKNKISPQATGNVTDVVCGMTIDPASAAGESQHGSQTYYFCSASCKTKFDADPHKYLVAHSH